MDSGKIIEVKTLHYRYPVNRRLGGDTGRCKEALRGVSFSVNEREKISIIGPNGAGKSTLMLNLAGLLEEKFKTGKIFVDGRELNCKNIYKIREKIGFVFQDPNDQLFSVKVFDDVAFGPINMGLPEEKVKKCVKMALKKVGLSGFEERCPHHLSFGEKKRIATATVLSMNPDILLLDEPTSNLDPNGRRLMINTLKTLKSTKIILALAGLGKQPIFKK